MDATAHLLEFCSSVRPKPFHHVSTMGVFTPGLLRLLQFIDVFSFHLMLCTQARHAGRAEFTCASRHQRENSKQV